MWPLAEGVDPLPAPKSFTDLIEPVINDFDFEKVNRCMKLLDWQWAGSNEPLGVPTIDRMRATARGLLTSVVSSKNSCYSQTGGFCAEKISDPVFNDNGLILRFVLETSESYFGDHYDD